MEKKPSPNKYIKLALKKGVKHAKIIATDTIVTATWVRLKCQYGCDGWGNRLTCPPYSPTPEQTAKMLSEYKIALLIQVDGSVDIKSLVAQFEREAFLDGYYKAFAMGAGPCHLCKECNLDELHCRHTERARPSMEACGIDVYQTDRNHDLPIQVVTDDKCEQNRYGIVLLE